MSVQVGKHFRTSFKQKAQRAGKERFHFLHGRKRDSPNAVTLAAMKEAELIEKDPAIKGYDDLDLLFSDLSPQESLFRPVITTILG